MNVILNLFIDCLFPNRNRTEIIINKNNYNINKNITNTRTAFKDSNLLKDKLGLETNVALDKSFNEIIDSKKSLNNIKLNILFTSSSNDNISENLNNNNNIYDKEKLSIDQINKIIKNFKLNQDSRNDLTNKIEEDSDDQDLCIICMDNKKSIVFLPCTHMHTCQECSNQLDNCPVCRGNILKKIKPIK
jgi:hypothetical protein